MKQSDSTTRWPAKASGLRANSLIVTMNSDATAGSAAQSRKAKAAPARRVQSIFPRPTIRALHRLGKRRLVLAVLDQVVDDRWIGQRRGVAEIGEIVLGDLEHDAPHDLARARLAEAG